ncbi:MAG: hypothetical protein HY078_05375 [Elusimicrobia bacterium]|nr:hypothetical protein [Elusimicrobiota bacterium]
MKKKRIDRKVSGPVRKVWGEKLATGQAPIIPIWIRGSKTLAVVRGTRRTLKVGLPYRNLVRASS